MNLSFHTRFLCSCYFIHQYFNNTFNEFKVLKKVTVTETFNIDFLNKFIEF